MTHAPPPDGARAWPELPLESWQDTFATLHMWTQIVGKTRLALAPPENHWWQVALYLTPRGLTTSPMPQGSRTLRGRFRFPRPSALSPHQRRRHRHAAARAPHRGRLLRRVPGGPAVARISESGMRPVPVEIEVAIPFTEDRQHAAYDAEAANRWWRLLVAGRPGAEAVPRPVPRQGEPGPLLLGRASTWRRRGSAAAARPPHPGGAPNCPDYVMMRGLLPRVQQLRLLARRRTDGGAGVLRLCLSRAARIRRAPRASGRSALPHRTFGSSSCPTTWCAPPPIPTRRCSTSANPRTRTPPISAAGTAPR